MNKELVDYIKQQMNINVSKNKITDILLKQGWHQSEIDEAFLAADGGGKMAQENDGGDYGGGQSDDFGREEGGSRPARKIIFIAVSALAVLAIIAGIMIFPNLGSDKQNSDNNATTAVDAILPDANATTSQAAAGEQQKIDDATLTAIKEFKSLIQPPAGWVAREGTIRTRPLVAFFKPVPEKDNAGKAVFNENISITRDNLAAVGVTDAAGYIAKSKTTLQSNIQGYKMLSERKAKLSDGTEATLINSSFAQNGLELKNTQMFVFKNSDVYIITGVALASNWDSEKDMIGMALLSFKFPSGQ